MPHHQGGSSSFIIVDFPAPQVPVKTNNIIFLTSALAYSLYYNYYAKFRFISLPIIYSPIIFVNKKATAPLTN